MLGTSIRDGEPGSRNRQEYRIRGGRRERVTGLNCLGLWWDFSPAIFSVIFSVIDRVVMHFSSDRVWLAEHLDFLL